VKIAEHIITNYTGGKMTINRLFYLIAFLLCVETPVIVAADSNVKKEVIIKSHIGSRDGEFGYKEYKDKSWVEPSALAVDSKGNIYVADPLNDRIQKFDKNGNFLFKIVLNIQKKYFEQTIDDLAIDENDNLNVLSRHEQKIFKYGADGRLIKIINFKKYIQAEKIAIDAVGSFYVFGFESGTEKLIKFNESGVLLTKWDKVSLFFLDREGYLYLNQEAHWRKYDKLQKYLGDVVCEKEPLKVFLPAPFNTCRFPPSFVDINGNLYYFAADPKTQQLTTLFKFNRNGEYKRYSIESVKAWPTPEMENMIKFDREGNLYGYNFDISSKEYSIIRITLN
jgi:hypothetical protein